MANGRTILPDLPEATDAQMTDGALATVWTQEQASASGFATKKSPLSKLANYVLNKYSALQLAGITQTVKSAIDSIMDGFGHLVDYVIGDTPMGTTADTITGAIAEHEGDITSLNSSLNSLIIVREFLSSEVTLNAGATTTVTVSCSVAGYTLLGAIGITTLSTEAMAIHRFYPNSAGDAVSVTLQNTYTAARTFTVLVRGIYKKA